MNIDPTIVGLIDKWLPYVLGATSTLALALFFFAYQLMRYGPAIRKLNNFETIAKLAYFADRHEDAAKAFGRAASSSDLVRQTAEQFKTELDSLRDFITDVQERMSEYNAEAITSVRLEEERSSRPDHIPTATGDPDTLYMSLTTAWERFLTALRARAEAAGITPRMSRIGRMTYQLTDRRRRNPLPTETADLITALHSQYKRYARMRATRSEWLTPELHDNFVQLVQTAIDEISKPSSQPELLLEEPSSQHSAGKIVNGTSSPIH